jgi:ABC-type glycerol-3-phosphate transport system permease component
VILLSIVAGYGYSKFFKFRGQGALLIFVLVSRMLPPIAIVVPLYEAFSEFKLLDTKTGLILIGSAISLPLGTWMLKTFFDEIPASVVEAATIDGCGRMRVLWSIILPLSKSAIASTVTITFLTSWNLFLIPLIFGKSLESKTLPVAISNLAFGEYGTQWGDLAALSVIMIVPVALIGLFGQRYLTTGLTAGAEKG